MDKIIIKNLLLRGVIGVYEWERNIQQDVRISITLYTDIRRAAETDSIKYSIDYKSVSKRIGELVEGSNYKLVESLAETIAKTCLDEFGASKVNVLVEKPNAVRFAETVGVEIERQREDGV